MANLIGFSKGLYSSWVYHSGSRSLFDCGEGCASYLGNKVFAIDQIFISHDHEDHVLGLIGLIGIRNLGRGNREKPLTIYYPEGSSKIELIKEFVAKTSGRFLKYDLRWIPISSGHEVTLNKKSKI